jgi:hypothetical protein
LADAKADSLPILIQFWTPNCLNHQNLIDRYNELERNFGLKISFYFIGITGSDSLLLSRVQMANYYPKLYKIDTTECFNLPICRDVFCYSFCRQLHIKQRAFMTLALDNNGQIYYIGNRVKISKRLINRMISDKK